MLKCACIKLIVENINNNCFLTLNLQSSPILLWKWKKKTTTIDFILYPTSIRVLHFSYICFYLRKPSYKTLKFLFKKYANLELFLKNYFLTETLFTWIKLKKKVYNN